MENQTRYDLGAAIENWQAELAAQANLTPDVRRELEAHLRDAIAGFQERGLNDEESFWLACRRVGQPQRLGEEFVKVDPAGAWRERAFWLAFGFLIIRLSNMLSFSVISQAMYYGYYPIDPFGTLGEGLPKPVAFYVPEWLDELPFMNFLQFFTALPDLLIVLAVIVFLARGQAGKMRLFFEFALKSRLQFFCVMMGLVVPTMAASNYLLSVLISRGAHFNIVAIDLRNGLGVVVLLGVCALLLPAQSQKPLKRA